MADYLLVPGACHGGWCFDPVADALRAAGHRVLAVTLTGVAERVHLAHAGVNLDTHVDDVVAAISAARFERVVLAGHSYSGMVISAVADRLPRRVDAAVFIDAVVPRDGESCWDLVDDEMRRWYLDVDDTGFGVKPMPHFDPRASAHPLASLLQPVRLTVGVNGCRRRDYVHALGWPGESPLRASFERVRTDPDWQVHELDGGHNLVRDCPRDLVLILENCNTFQSGPRTPLR